MAQVEWKGIEGFPNYRISTEGIVQSNFRGSWKVVKPGIKKSGYYYLGLYFQTARKYFRLHRLVWQTFAGCIPDTHVVDHIDNNKSNNKLNNLQLLTWSENTIKYHKQKQIK